MLFIILFLHQTTTRHPLQRFRECCLSSCSYIKPQRASSAGHRGKVVYHLVPTSNHNCRAMKMKLTKVVYHLVPTSNHNNTNDWVVAVSLFIILFLHQTTTINYHHIMGHELFIILFLHQTTTLVFLCFRSSRCLSSCSYIKPQPEPSEYTCLLRCLSSCSYIKPQRTKLICSLLVRLFIILFLHQTTTYSRKSTGNQ